MAYQTTKTATPILDPNHELRIHTSQQACTVTVVRGTAESFGMSLVVGQSYHVPVATDLSIYTWTGCELQIKGQPESVYTVPDNSIHQCYQAFERIIDAAPSGIGLNGVLIVGQQGTGKNAVFQTLLNYTQRCEHKCIAVDLDPCGNQFYCPGFVSAVQMYSPLSALLPCGQGHQPLAYCCGKLQVSMYDKCYADACNSLAGRVASRLKKLGPSCVIVNTPPYPYEQQAESVAMLLQMYSITTVLVVGDERLYHNLVALDKSTTFINMRPAITYPCQHSRTQRTGNHYLSTQFKAYFYGGLDRPKLQAVQSTHSFHDARLVSYMEPATKRVDWTIFKYSLMALCDPEHSAADPRPVLGTVYIADVDAANRIITVLSPSNGLSTQLSLFDLGMKLIDV